MRKQTISKEEEHYRKYSRYADEDLQKQRDYEKLLKKRFFQNKKKWFALLTAALALPALFFLLKDTEAGLRIRSMFFSDKEALSVRSEMVTGILGPEAATGSEAEFETEIGAGFDAGFDIGFDASSGVNSGLGAEKGFAEHSDTADPSGTTDSSDTADPSRTADPSGTADSSEAGSTKGNKQNNGGTQEQDMTEPADLVPDFLPEALENTQPERLISYTNIEYNGILLDDPSEYAPWYQMDFGSGQSYSQVEGVIGFRGDNFRNSPVWGTVDFSKNSLEPVWSKDTGGLTWQNATWTGSGWTGQPLIVKWPEQTRIHMNLYDQARSKPDLVEVIYACMDGYVYFLDLQTGEATRDPLYLGFTFKGSGALDPRGYPILYLGAGYDSANGRARAFIINLLDCSVMYTFGCVDPFSLRGNLSFFDSSALVDAASDTLIYPGENGILYLIRLNTRYEEETGTLSIDPGDFVKWRYMGVRTGYTYWVGMEDSAAVYRGYLYIADNGGNLMCLDLNTLKLVWVQDILDDSNSTPVLSVENGKLYLYVSTSFHLGWRSSSTASIPIWKIDAQSGEIVWQTEYTCYTEDGVSGGVQSTIAVGEKELADYVYVTVARTGGYSEGVLACLRKDTGEIVWEDAGAYTWSSPVCVYSSEGQGRVLYCNGAGNLHMLDGKTGERLSSVSLSQGVIEASPAVFNEMLVVGTRACKIWGVRLE